MTAQPARAGDQRPDRLGGGLSRTGPGSASPAETAAYLAAKADLLDRIAAGREHGGRASADITTARQAADAARAAARLAAITTLEES